VQADLATYGKILGGGMPIGALAGRADCLDALDGGMWNFGDDSQPEAGMTFFAGTYVRHPLAMAAAHATLRHLKQQGPELQSRLNERASRAAHELRAFLAERGAPIRIETFSSMFFVTFAPEFAYGPLLFFHLREKGIHAWDNRLFFFSTAHTDADIARLVAAFKESVRELQSGGFFETEPEAAISVGSNGANGVLHFAPTEAQQELILAHSHGRGRVEFL
jgi:glutamate-1-semialdehyde aminotransferase